MQATILSDDCDALLIPSAAPITLPAGTQVHITQLKGGTATVQVDGQLMRIEPHSLAALGLPDVTLASLTTPPPTVNQDLDGPADLDLIWEQLKTCYDPEIPINIVDLGLIYTCEATPAADGLGSDIKITMTLTAPGCGMGPVLANDVETKIAALNNVASVVVEIVFEPVWTQDRMSEAAQLELGLL